MTSFAVTSDVSPRLSTKTLRALCVIHVLQMDGTGGFYSIGEEKGEDGLVAVALNGCIMLRVEADRFALALKRRYVGASIEVERLYDLAVADVGHPSESV